MSDAMTTSSNTPNNDVVVPVVLNEKFMEEHIQYKLDIKAIKKEQDSIKENYITKDYVNLKLTNLENNLEHKFNDKFVTLERKFDDKFNEVDKALVRMEAKISKSMFTMMSSIVAIMATFMAILFFLLQHYK